MVGHPPEGMNAYPELGHHLADDIVERVPIGARSEERLAVVTAKHHVIMPTGHMQGKRPVWARSLSVGFKMMLRVCSGTVDVSAWSPDGHFAQER
jgi:hypothetical protein